ncbi:larval/pupal cuticle protein H1C-like [Coccinella septempunctata]|uniref:larval/pupal cuticle protein H1C-like n=1 Tax=Coccinella septempunctata TaxID=41139 RepID=UPI001D078CFE|nr:larval/pupal cuticle protein H1C-like [Coccinella septempunctata]
MAFKLVVLCAALAYANAGLIPAASPATAVSHAYISQPTLAVAHAAPVAIHDPAIATSQHNVYRSLGGNAAISTYSKALDSAFSSVRKYDTRVTNDATPVYAVAHAAPVATYAHVAPVATYAHAAPVATYTHSPSIATYAAPHQVVAKTAIAYSPSVEVSHMTFSGLGVNYAW